MLHKLKNLKGKTVKWARAWKNASHANMPDGTKKHGNFIAIRFTDGSELACTAAADSMDVVFVIVPPNEKS